MMYVAPEKDGIILYFDDNHLSRTFGQTLASDIEAYLARAGYLNKE